MTRFGVIEGEKDKSALYMLANPTGVAKKQKSYLQKWSPSEGGLVKVSELDESLSALAVRDDGRFVALGTMFSGSVSIYIAFSLQVNLLWIFWDFWFYQIFLEGVTHSWGTFHVCYWFGVFASCCK